MISGLAAATAADLHTAGMPLNCGDMPGVPEFETAPLNLDPCASCPDLDGTYILYHGGTDDPRCGYINSVGTHWKETCIYNPLTLPTECDVEQITLDLSKDVSGGDQKIRLTIDFKGYCTTGGSFDPCDCGVARSYYPYGCAVDEVFYSASLWWEADLSDALIYDGFDCCTFTDFALDEFDQTRPEIMMMDANGDCSVTGPSGEGYGFHRRCTSGGAGTIKITALED